MYIIIKSYIITVNTRAAAIQTRFSINSFIAMMAFVYNEFVFHRVLLMGADLMLNAGHRYGLIGRNGVGKTTLLRSLSR